MKRLLVLCALASVALLAGAQTLTAPAISRMHLIQAPVQTPPPTPTTSESASAGCPDYQMAYAGSCWDKSPQFGTYFSIAAHCGDHGGRLPMLGELAGFTAHFNLSGIECSSDFDSGSGTLWCASNNGASGVGLSQQVKSLYEINESFRCVYPRAN